MNAKTVSRKPRGLALRWLRFSSNHQAFRGQSSPLWPLGKQGGLDCHITSIYPCVPHWFTYPSPPTDPIPKHAKNGIGKATGSPETLVSHFRLGYLKQQKCETRVSWETVASTDYSFMIYFSSSWYQGLTVASIQETQGPRAPMTALESFMWVLVSEDAFAVLQYWFVKIVSMFLILLSRLWVEQTFWFVQITDNVKNLWLIKTICIIGKII